jgi:hypothetical protein
MHNLCLNSRAKTGVLNRIRLTHWALLSAPMRAPGWKRILTQSALPTECVGRTGDPRTQGLPANLQPLNRKWLGSRQYEFNKMFREPGGLLNCAQSQSSVIETA